MEYDLFVGFSVKNMYLKWCKENCFKEVEFKFVETAIEPDKRSELGDEFNAYLIFTDEQDRFKFMLYFAEEVSTIQNTKIEEKENGIIQRFAPDM